MRKKTFSENLNDITFQMDEVASILDDTILEFVEPNGADIPDHLDDYISNLNDAIDTLQERIRDAKHELTS